MPKENVLEKVKNFVFNTPKTRTIVTKNIGGEVDVDHIDEELLKEAGYARAKAVTSNAENKKLRKIIETYQKKQQHKQRAENIEAQELEEQDNELSKATFDKSFKMSYFFKLDKKGKMRGKKISVTSYDHETVFGKFEDIVFLKNGRMAVLVKDAQEKIHPIIIGSQTIDIFTGYNAFQTLTRRNLMPVNLTNEGKPHRNMFAEDVPRLIISDKGKLQRGSYDTKKAQEVIDELHLQIMELQGQLERRESALNKTSLKVRQNQQANIILKENAGSSDKNLIESLKQVGSQNEAIQALQKEGHITSFMKGIQEDLNTKKDQVIDTITAKLGTTLGETNMERSKEDLQSTLNWGMNLISQASVDALKKAELQIKSLEQEVKQKDIELKSATPTP